MSDLDVIRERHDPHDHDGLTVCGADNHLWPCDTAQALARVDELEAALGEYLGAAHDGLGPEDERKLRAALASEPQP